MIAARPLLVLVALAALGACGPRGAVPDERVPDKAFARPLRAVAAPHDSPLASEREREARGEAQTVMDLAHLQPGMTVADIGAGEGYYTVRLADRLGPKGRVLAQDIDGAALRRLGIRVEHDRLATVSIKQGAPDDPRLPRASFDRVFLVHVYSEVADPYPFLWRLRPALREGGRVVVVEHMPAGGGGLPPRQLLCEFGQVGFRAVEFALKPEIAGYYAEFAAEGARPQPEAIRACRADGTPA